MKQLLISIFVAGAFLGCTPLKNKKDLESLEPSVLQFYEQLKWGRGALAKSYIMPAARPKFLDDVDEASKKLKISYIKVIRITPYKKNTLAAVRLRVVWHLVDEGIVHETVIEDTWKRFKTTWLKKSSKRIKRETDALDIHRVTVQRIFSHPPRK